MLPWIELVLVVFAVCCVILGFVLRPGKVQEKPSQYHDPKTHFYQTMGTTKPSVPSKRKLPPMVSDDTREIAAVMNDQTAPLRIVGRHAYEG